MIGTSGTSQLRVGLRSSEAGTLDLDKTSAHRITGISGTQMDCHPARISGPPVSMLCRHVSQGMSMRCTRSSGRCKITTLRTSEEENLSCRTSTQGAMRVFRSNSLIGDRAIIQINRTIARIQITGKTDMTAKFKSWTIVALKGR